MRSSYRGGRVIEVVGLLRWLGYRGGQVIEVVES